VIQQLVVDESFEEAVKSFSKDAVVQSLQASLEYARSNFHKKRGDRLAEGKRKRADASEGYLKKDIAVLEKRLADMKSRKKWDADTEFSQKILNKWKGGALSGLLFDRGRSTIGRHMEQVALIDKALKTFSAVPIEVDDSGEGSYQGWAFHVCYSLRDWIAVYGDHWLHSRRDLKPWQWLAGVVAWDRLGPDKERDDAFAQACEPGWHWLRFDEERTISSNERTVDRESWKNVVKKRK
jgi:hypothetical protein